MAFNLHIRKQRPDLSRITGVQEPPSALTVSKLAFWRGACLGFVSAMAVFDFFLLNGATLARVMFALRYAIWSIGHAVHG